MTRACEHCGNPDKSKWMTGCLYKGAYPSRRAFVLSTFDAPCASDAYDEDRAQSRRQNRPWVWLWSSLASIGLFAIWVALR